MQRRGNRISLTVLFFRSYGMLGEMTVLGGLCNTQNSEAQKTDVQQNVRLCRALDTKKFVIVALAEDFLI